MRKPFSAPSVAGAPGGGKEADAVALLQKSFPGKNGGNPWNDAGKGKPAGKEDHRKVERAFKLNESKNGSRRNFCAA